VTPAQARDAEQALEDAIHDRDAHSLALWGFGFDATPGQVEILRPIMFGTTRRLIVSAYTQYGKTRTIGIGLAGRMLLDPDPLDFRLLAPRLEQTEQLRGYVVDAILANPLLRGNLKSDVTRVERLNAELSRRRLTFHDGKVLHIHTAEGKAFRLMGAGGDVIATVESCLIEDDAWDKIGRMVGGRPPADGLPADVPHGQGWIVKEGNPWHMGNHYYRHWKDPTWTRVHINADQGLLEGRITKGFLDEQRRELVPARYRVLYDSQFPDVAEGQLFPGPWVDDAMTRDALTVGSVAWSLDVANGGTDRTVLTRFLEAGTRRHATDQYEADFGDTEETADWVHGLIGDHADVVVDANGVGAGVADKLRRKGHEVTFMVQAEAPSDDQFQNRKAEVFWAARTALETGQASISPNLRTLRAQLLGFRWSLDGRGKTRIEDPQGKSPDHGDSWVYRWARRIGPRPRPRGVAKPNPLTRVGPI
jgi:hypothetical protein